MSHRPKVCIVGAGAAGLWCAIRLVESGWGSGGDLTIVEPDAKESDDHTWSYWLREQILPDSVDTRTYRSVELAVDGRRKQFDCKPYWYESIRSSEFYAYAKGVLAKAGATWISGTVDDLSLIAEHKVEIRVTTGSGSHLFLNADYVLDSRLPTVDVDDPQYLTTLQHFGGRFVRFDRPVLATDCAVFMDFVNVGGEVAFFYVLPQAESVGLVEIAIFSKSVWSHERYDAALDDYMADRFRQNESAVPYEILDAEYGVIPMTDRPLWRDSTSRIWKIGTAGGWVQPSSGYAFTRCARFATEVAEALLEARPTPWRPSQVQQVFNSTMLGYIIDKPDEAGQIFYELFARNGAARTFSFLDEESSLTETLRLMWTSPKRSFARRAVSETAKRLVGTK